MDLRVVNTGSPFRVTTANAAGTTWARGSAQTLTWDVAGTSGPLIGVSKVDVFLSYDNGVTFTEVLSDTPNDGSANFTVPANAPNTSQARVKIKADGNVFFDWNDAPVTISAPVVPITPDRFEANDSFAAATDLGTIGRRVENDLSFHVGGDQDYYRFVAAASGTATFSLAFSDAESDLDAELFNASGQRLGGSAGTGDSEVFTAPVVAGQAYVLRAFSYDARTLRDYDLVIDAPADSAAPVLTGSEFLFEDRQSLRMSFDEAVDENAFSSAGVVVRNLTTGQTLDNGRFFFAAGGDRVEMLYRIADFGPMPDGDYRVTLPAGAVRDLAGNATTTPSSAEFFVLAGDATRDRRVDLADFLALRQNFGRVGGTTFSGADFDYSGRVDLGDFLILRQQFGRSLTPPPAGGSLFGGDDE